MANLIKIGHVFLNIDRVQRIEDLFGASRENTLVIRFGPAEGDAHSLSGQEADDLRTWLNSVAVNVHAAVRAESDV